MFLRLAQELKFQVEERRLKLEDFLEAEEVFATNATQEMMPVVRIGERSDWNGGARTPNASAFRRTSPFRGPVSSAESWLTTSCGTIIWTVRTAPVARIIKIASTAM
ncbi:MAG: hypothetical protein HC888_13690 [Candidatus Competibacteraceae bacterium]|nr:hypothetical protein [Candidatus Competibacteraceae bacterium]